VVTRCRRITVDNHTVTKLSVNGDNCSISALSLLARQIIAKAVYDVFLRYILTVTIRLLKIATKSLDAVCVLVTSDHDDVEQNSVSLEEICCER